MFTKIPEVISADKSLAPLSAVLSDTLMTVNELARRWSYQSEGNLANARRAGKPPAFIKLPSGGIRYRTSDVLAVESGNHGFNFEKALDVLSFCPGVSLKLRAEVDAFLRQNRDEICRTESIAISDLPAMYAPLQAKLDILIKPSELAKRWRFDGVGTLANIRRSGVPLKFLRLPGGGIRYRICDIVGHEIAGRHGPPTLHRLALAVAALPDTSSEDRMKLITHVMSELEQRPAWP